MSRQLSGTKVKNEAKKERTLQQLISEQQVISYPDEVEASRKGGNGEFGNRLANIARLSFTTIGWLILLRILFKFIAAQPDQPIASFVYEFTETFVAPFYGIVTNETFDSGSNVMAVAEFSSMVAIVVYNIAGGIVSSFIRALFGKPTK